MKIKLNQIMKNLPKININKYKNIFPEKKKVMKTILILNYSGKLTRK